MSISLDIGSSHMRSLRRQRYRLIGRSCRSLFTELADRESHREILNRLDTVKRTMESYRRFERGVLRVVSMPGPSVFLLPDLISRFVEGKERVQVTLSTRTSVQAQRLIANQEFDVGLADFGYGAAGDSRLIDHEVITFECLCAIPADDPMTEKDVITAADLNGKPLATLVRSHPAQDPISKFPASARGVEDCARSGRALRQIHCTAT